jgi:hypothetical protein
VTVVAGRYRLLARLGQGGMGVVWRAHDELLRRDVAVKELRVRLGVDGDFQARQVLREARAAARLRHPGVVAVHDVIVDDGRMLIVMELIEGPSLSELVRAEGPLPEQRVAEIGTRVLAALSVAHAQGVVHRDVKPANIMIDGDRVVLTDFGIAAMTTDTTLTDTVLGSPEYLAPERVNGEQATPATDLWSLGVTLCAALRGESPFQRSDTQATLAAVLTYDPPPLVGAPRLWPILAGLLRKNPGERLTALAAGEMMAAVAGTAFEPATGPVESPTTLIPAVTTARRRLAALLAVLVLVVAAAVWLVIRPGGEAVGGTAMPVSTTAPTVSAPPGFTGHRGNGFTIVVPEGWFKEETNEHAITWVLDPHEQFNVLVHVEWWDEVEPGGALGVLTRLERNEFTMDYITNYQRLRLEEKPAPPGMVSAELEFTLHLDTDREFDSHELTRAVVTSERTYILSLAADGNTLAAADQLWQNHLGELTTVLDSFRVTA